MIVKIVFVLFKIKILVANTSYFDYKLFYIRIMQST